MEEAPTMERVSQTPGLEPMNGGLPVSIGTHINVETKLLEKSMKMGLARTTIMTVEATVQITAITG